MTFDEIVSDYVRVYRDDAREEMRGFASERSPSAAIRRAALCETQNGKRNAHQRRIPRVLLEQVEVRLQAISRNLAKAADFAALHKLVDDAAEGIKGIGALTVYDIAHRIGAYFGKAPKHVYLHAGTRIGARALNIKGDLIGPKTLPKPFIRLTPAEIEDCLCIYKDEMRGVRSHGAGRTTGCGQARRQRSRAV